MDIVRIAQRIDPAAAEAFVRAARHVIDALVIEAGRIHETRAPARIDYNAAELPRETPPGGWLSTDELRAASQRLTEAIAAEKWTDGFLVAVRLMVAMGAAA